MIQLNSRNCTLGTVKINSPPTFPHLRCLNRFPYQVSRKSCNRFAIGVNRAIVAFKCFVICFYRPRATFDSSDSEIHACRKQVARYIIRGLPKWVLRGLKSVQTLNPLRLLAVVSLNSALSYLEFLYFGLSNDYKAFIRLTTALRSFK